MSVSLLQCLSHMSVSLLQCLCLFAAGVPEGRSFARAQVLPLQRHAHVRQAQAARERGLRGVQLLLRPPPAPLQGVARPGVRAG